MSSIPHHFPIPKNENDFEELCLLLLRRVWNCPDAKRFGRRGHGQHGVDIFGVDQAKKVRGGQCKLHEPGKKLQPKEDVREEVQKAKQFQPPLDTYTILTTAKRDPSIQTLAGEITLEHRDKGLFSVDVMFQDDIEERLREYPDVEGTFYGGLGHTQAEIIAQRLSDIEEPVKEATRSAQQQRVDDDIERARELIRRWDAVGAIELLERLRKQKWHSCSSAQRFRILANAGRAHELCGDQAAAARLFLQAKDELPDEPRARALEVAARLHLGEEPEAFALADQLVADFPNSPDAWAVWTSTAPEEYTLDAIEERIPEQLFDSADVAHALSRSALERGLSDDAERYAWKAVDVAPDSCVALENLANTLLQSYYGYMPGITIAPLDSGKIEECEKMYSELLAKLGTRAPPVVRARVHFNRGTALSLLRRRTDAERERELAYSLNPASPEYASAYACILADRGSMDDAIRVLRDNLKLRPAPETAALAVELLLERGSDGDAEEAVSVVQTALTAYAPSDACARVMLLDKCIDAFMAANRPEPLAAIVEEQNDLPQEAASAVQAKLSLVRGQKEDAGASARIAAETIDASTPAPLKRYIALLLQSGGLFAEALDLWRQIVPLNVLSVDTFSLLECARRMRQHKSILECCKALRDSRVYDIRLYDYEVGTLEQLNEIDRAIEVTQEYLGALTGDEYLRYLRFRLSCFGIFRNRPELIEKDAGQLPLVEKVEPPLGEEVVKMLAHVDQHAEAMKYAYELLRRFPASLEAHRAMIASFGIGRGKDVAVPKSDTVAPGFAVCYVEGDTKNEQWWIIEDCPNPDPSRREWPPDCEIAREVMGKNVGDSFYLRRHALQDRKGTVKEIVSKYVYRFRDCMQHWEERFPSDGTFVKFTVAGEPSGEVDMAVMLRAIDAKVEHVEQAESVFRDKDLPISWFAQVTGTSVLEVMSHLASSANEIRCSHGTWNERQAAVHALRTARELVIDPSALGTLFLTDAYAAITDWPIPMVVSRGALRELRGLLESIVEHGGFVGKLGGQYYFTKDTGAAEYKAKLQSFIGTIETSCRVEGGSAVLQLPETEQEQLPKLIGRSTTEAIALARQSGRVLWADDRRLAGYASSEHGTSTVWTQIAVAYAAEQGFVTPATEVSITLMLLRCGYSFTALTPKAISVAAEQAGYDPDNEPLNSVIDRLGREEMDRRGLLLMGALLIKDSWQKAPLEDQAQAVTAAVLRQCASLETRFKLIESLRKILDSVFGLDVVTADKAGRSIEAWLRLAKTPLI